MADFGKPRDGGLAAGRLQDLIDVYEITPTKANRAGPPVELTRFAFKVWAEYTGFSSSESAPSANLDKRKSTTTGKFIIRYRDDIHAATHQIGFDGKRWNISEPIHDQRRTMTLIEASIVE